MAFNKVKSSIYIILVISSLQLAQAGEKSVYFPDRIKTANGRLASLVKTALQENDCLGEILKKKNKEDASLDVAFEWYQEHTYYKMVQRINPIETEKIARQFETLCHKFQKILPEIIEATKEEDEELFALLEQDDSQLKTQAIVDHIFDALISGHCQLPGSTSIKLKSLTEVIIKNRRLICPDINNPFRPKSPIKAAHSDAFK